MKKSIALIVMVLVMTVPLYAVFLYTFERTPSTAWLYTGITILVWALGQWLFSRKVRRDKA
ncbi:MAG: hypothetical protein JO301_04005 [Chitinophagaceae bacterium]|nr:hypothetical protein [Chitinophagaceae bacterium]